MAGGTVVEYGGDSYQLMTINQVLAANAGLSLVTVDALESRFDGRELDRHRIYFGPWTDPGAFTELAESFRKLKHCFVEAVSLGRGMLAFLEDH